MLLSGTVLIFITALIGSQFIVEGKIYKDKLKSLENKGYDINNTLCWADYDQWKDTEIMGKLKGKFTTAVVQASTWQD